MSGGIGAVRGYQGYIGDGRWTGSPITLGPSPGYQHSHWFPLGSDLPHQGQARAPVEGPITPTGFPCGVTYLAKTKQVTEMSSACYYIHLELYLVTVCTFVSIAASLHILTCNVKKCYMDYFLSRHIYTYTYTINLMYCNTMVLIMKN